MRYNGGDGAKNMERSEQRAREIIARIGAGMPPQVVQAMLDCADRVGWNVSPNAAAKPWHVSRQATLTSGTSSAQSIRLGAPVIATMITGRAFFTDADDDSTMIKVRWEVPSVAGYLLGDSDQDLNLATLAEISSWLPQLKPWVLWPLDESRITFTAGVMAGTATAVVGLAGLSLTGFGAGA